MHTKTVRRLLHPRSSDILTRLVIKSPSLGPGTRAVNFAGEIWVLFMAICRSQNHIGANFSQNAYEDCTSPVAPSFLRHSHPPCCKSPSLGPGTRAVNFAG